jgi:hypothetical protein
MPLYTHRGIQIEWQHFSLMRSLVGQVASASTGLPPQLRELPSAGSGLPSEVGDTGLLNHGDVPHLPLNEWVPNNGIYLGLANESRNLVHSPDHPPSNNNNNTPVGSANNEQDSTLNRPSFESSITMPDLPPIDQVHVPGMGARNDPFTGTLEFLNGQIQSEPETETQLMNQFFTNRIQTLQGNNGLLRSLVASLAHRLRHLYRDHENPDGGRLWETVQTILSSTLAESGVGRSENASTALIN